MTKRIIALCLALVILLSCSVAFADTVGDRVHYIPTRITVTSSRVTVEGYFVNLNSGYNVKNFRNYEMTVYYRGRAILDGYFGTLTSFTVYSLGVKYCTFEWSGRQGLSTGTYSCDDTYYCDWGGTISYY